MEPLLTAHYFEMTLSISIKILRQDLDKLQRFSLYYMYVPHMRTKPK